MVSAVTDKAAEKLRLGIMLRDIGFIACSDEIAHKDDTDPNLNEHTIRGLEIISGLNDELVEAIVRYHHSTLKSNDYPTDLSSDILKCVNIALVCNRLEELVYGPDPCPKKEALEAIRAETEEGYWPQEVFVASKMLTKRHVAFEHFGRHVLHCFFALPSIKAASMRWLAPLNSTSLPWWTILSIMADASLSSPRTVPHFENSMFVVNIMLRLS